MLASFCALVCLFLGDALALVGLDVLVGDADLTARERGVLVGGASLILSSGNSNFGGAAIGFLALEGVCAMSVGSRSARIHSVKPYSEASSRARMQGQWKKATRVGDDTIERTKFRRNPDIACNFILAGRVEALEIVTLRLLLCMSSPRKCNLKHAGGAHKAIFASPLRSSQTSGVLLTGSIRTIKKYVSG